MSETKQVEDFAVVQAMHRYGGSFVCALADAFDRADKDNVARLKAAFPEYWEEYRRMASQVAEMITESRSV